MTQAITTDRPREAPPPSRPSLAEKLDGTHGTVQPGFVKRHPVLTYYALTFVISFSAPLLVIAGRTGIIATAEQAANFRPAVALLTLTGPVIASIVLTGLVYGRAGYRELLARLLRWRVDARWYVLALVTGPILLTATLFALLPTSPVFLPAILATGDKPSLLLSSLIAGLVVGVCEELGWTGFAIPGLRRGYGVLGTALIVGFLWGIWHMPSQIWFAGDASGALSPAILVQETIFAMTMLPAYRILMVWVYEHTQSLLLAMLMHAGLSGSLVALFPVGISGALIWNAVVAVVAWAVVAAVFVVQSRENRT